MSRNASLPLRLLVLRLWLLFASGLVGWILACGAELLWRGTLSGLTEEALLWLVFVALLYSGLCASGVGLLHLVAGWTGFGWLRAPRSGALLCALTAAYPAWQQSVFLTSGDWIASRGYGLVIQLGLLACFILGAAALWLWHSFAWNRIGAQDSAEAPSRRRWALVVWAAGGVLCLALLTRAVALSLDYYSFFANALKWPIWLLAASLLSVLIGDLGRPGVLLSGGFVVVAVGSSLLLLPRERLGAARVHTAAAGQLAAFAEGAVWMKRRSVARLDLSAAEGFDCSREPPRTARPLDLERGTPRNVILISVDALREDVIRPTLDGRPLAPNLHAFSRRSLYFPNAQTTYPATVLAIGSALTGLTPAQLLMLGQPPRNVLAGTRDLFERQVAILPDSGWFRMPIIETLFLQGTPVRWSVDDAAATNTLIEELRRARAGRTFAWVHYFAPHQPYRSHPGLDFGSSARARYLSEVAYLDAQFGRLFRYLESDGWLEDSLVIIFSDHGQALGEQGYFGHHVYLNGWIADVPLMVRYPGAQPSTAPSVVELLDVAPTILHFLGRPIPAQWTGVSLIETVSGAADLERFAVAEAFPVRGSRLFEMADRPIRSLEMLQERLGRIQESSRSYEPKVSIVRGRYRMIVSRDTGAIQLYDRERDPLERDNLVTREAQIAGALTDSLRSWHVRQSELIYCSAVADGSGASDLASHPSSARR